MNTINPVQSFKMETVNSSRLNDQVLESRKNFLTGKESFTNPAKAEATKLEPKADKKAEAKDKPEGKMNVGKTAFYTAVGGFISTQILKSVQHNSLLGALFWSLLARPFNKHAVLNATGGNKELANKAQGLTTWAPITAVLAQRAAKTKNPIGKAWNAFLAMMLGIPAAKNAVGAGQEVSSLMQGVKI